MTRVDRMLDKAADLERQAKMTKDVEATFMRERAADLRRWAESEKVAAS
jgi:hypothetical protein